MKDTHTYGKKMARNGRTKVIYKERFICIQTLSEVIIKCILISGNVVILREIGTRFCIGVWKKRLQTPFFDSMMDGALATSTPFANNTNKMHMPAQMLFAQCRSRFVSSTF